MELINNWIIERKPGYPLVYRLDIPNYSFREIVLGNPGIVDAESWIEDVHTSRAMPGWSGVISYFDGNKKRLERSIVGYYQFTFPTDSELAGVWRLDGFDGFGVGTRVILQNAMTGKKIVKTINEPMRAERPRREEADNDFIPEYIPTFGEVVLEAEITPVYHLNLLALSCFRLQPKPVTLLELLNIGCKLDFVFNGETFHFVVAGNKPNAQVALQPNCQSCLLVNVQVIVNGVSYSLTLQTINHVLPTINTSNGWNLGDGEWQDFSNDLECYIGYLVMEHSRATVVTNLTVHQVSTTSVAMNVVKAMLLSTPLPDDLSI